MLTILIKAIANNIFRNYNTIKKLLKIELSKNKIYYLQQNKSVFGKLFFYVVFINKIKKVNIFSRRLKESEVRAKYLQFLIIYNFKIKNLYFVNRVLLSSFLT